MSRKRLEREPMEEMGIHSSMTAENAQKRNRERKIVRRVCSALSVMVAAFMFYYLMKPAITMETHPGDGNPQLICGLEEHVHTEACWGYDHEAYEPVYVNSTTLNCTFLPHVHDENCYDMDGNLICGISEEYRHVHDMYCYDHGTLICTLEEHTAEDDMEEISVLVCGQEESTGHVHTDACYTTMWFTDEEPICGLQEGGPHIHVDECYGPVLVCEEDHEHTDACFVEGLICGLEEGQEHVHALECYPSMKELSCGQEETVGHTHTEACYAMQLVEKEIHVHGEECYTDGVLTCGKMEIRTHQHTPECWQETQVLVNGGHVHNEECVKILVCGHEEHVHSQACYSGDPEAVKALVQENGCEEPVMPETEDNADTSEAPVEEELAAEGTDKLTAQNGDVSETAGKEEISEEEHTENEAQEDSSLSLGEESELVEETPEDLSFESDALELVEEDVEWDSETVLVEEEQTETEAQTGSENHDPVSMDETVETETVPEAGSDEMEGQTASDEHEPVPQNETAESVGQPEKVAGDAGTETLPVEENTETDVSTEGEHASGEQVEVEEHIDGNSTEIAENPIPQAASEHEAQEQFTSLHFVTDITRSEEGQFSVQLHTDEGVRVQDILEVAGVAADQVSIASDIPFLEIGEDYFACRFAFGEGSVVLTAGETEITVLCSFVSGQAAETESDQEAADDMPEEAGAQPEDQTAEEDGTESTTGTDKEHAGDADASTTDSGDGESDTNKEENGGENQEASAEDSQNSGSTAEGDAGAGGGAEENLNEGSQKAAESEDAHAGEEEAGSETGSEEDAAGADDETGNTENEGEGTAEADDSESSDETADADDGHMSRENAGTVSSEDPNAEVRENPEITVLLNGEATEQVRAELVTEDAQALMALVQGYLQTEHNTNLDETAEETAEEVNEVTEAQIWRVLRVSSEEMMEGHAEITVPVNEDFAGVIPQNADLTSVNYRIFRVDEENGVVIPADNFTVDADAETVKSFSLGTDESGVYAFVCTVSYAYREYQAEIELDLSDFMVVPEELSGESGISVITESAAENVPDQGSAMRRQTMSRQSKKMSTAPAAESAGIAIDMQKLMDQLEAQGIDTENEFAGIRLSMNADEGADMDFSGMSEESSDGNVFFDGQSLKILDNGTVVLKGKHITVTVRVVGFHKAGETSTYEFTFGENKSVYMSEIFTSVGMPESFVPARFSYTLSDESLVSLVREGNDCLVTANDFFDEVTLNIERGWYKGIILLRNINPETEEKTEMWSEDGTVSILLKDAVALPEGTKPAAVPSEGVDIQEYLAADFGENADVQLKWFDISLGDVHEISATVTLPGVIELPENPENRVMHVYARVYHVREDGIHALDAAVNGSDITFETDGFSEFGIAWVVTFENEETGETYTLTLPGARDIPLDEILESIGFNADPADEAEAENETAQNDEKRVEKVESSDEEIVRILQTEEGWAVRILKEGKAHLIITMNDETVITIHVVSQGITKKTSDDETVEISTVNSLYLPEDAYVKAEQLDDVSAQTAIETVKANTAFAKSGEENGRTVYKVFDISLENVNTDEYDGFQVAVRLPENIVGRDFRLFHIHEGITEEIGLETIAGTNNMDGQTAIAGIAFETNGFSEFVVSYTVDFSYAVNGKMYEFSLSGGGFIRFADLVEALFITEETNEAGVDQFVSNVKNVEFSDPGLIWVGKSEKDSTVGQLKVLYGLECEYSATLSEEQLKEINNSVVIADEWLLISMKAFDTEETLTVTMMDGEKFVVKVTDAQIKKIGKTKADNVVIREAHYSLSAKVTTIPEKGTHVTLLGTAEGILGGLFSHWYHIEYTDEKGVVYTGYVEQDKIDIIDVLETDPVDYNYFTALLRYEDGVLPEGAVLAVNTVSLDNATIEEYWALIEEQLSTGSENKGIRSSISTIEFFDLSVFSEGDEVQPDGEVRISLSLKTPIALKTDEKIRVIHFTSDNMANVLPEEKVELKTDENGLITDVSFITDGFSTYALATVLEQDYIARDGNLYHVTVTYGTDAKLPKDATLNVTQFDESSNEYAYARKAVLADKKARGEWVDLSSFGLAALDISIMNLDGEEIEPEAPVRVDIRIKELPGVEKLDEIVDTLAIQHHVEVENGVVVDTVFGGNAGASFTLETNETVAAQGIVVDPNSVSEGDFSEVETPVSYPDVEPVDDGIEVSFQTPMFSTFTVTWNGTSTVSNNVSYLWATAAGVNTYQFNDDGTYAGTTALQTNNLHYMNSSQLGIPGYIIRTSETETATGDLYLVYNHTGYGAGDQNVSEADSTFHIRFNHNGKTYADVTVHYVDSEGNPIRRTKTSDVSYTGGAVDTRSVDGTNSNRNLRNYAGTKNGYTFSGVSEIKPSNQPPHATIHYVDENNNELPVSNGSISSSTLLNNYAYLIYDIEGGEYEYKETYIRRNSSNTGIRAYLHWNGTNWRYTTNGSNWTNVNENDDIYVVYKKKATPTEGGTPTLVELDENDKPNAPTVAKDSTINGDGTNTISLSVTSHTKPREVLKLADVIVIFDRSGSMQRNIDNSYNASTTEARRMALLQNEINKLADDLIGDNSEYIYIDKEGVKHKQIEMSLVSFSTTATDATSFTDNAGTFKGWINALTPDGGTNWEQALQKANEASVDEGRATFVIFVTDGEPTFRMSRMTDTDISLASDIYFPYSYSDFGTIYRDNNVYGKGDSDDYDRDYYAALEQAKAIVGNNKNLYMIGVGPEVENLEQFNNDAGADGYYPATSSEDLTSAFKDIKKRIAALAGYSDFQITDGITDLTQTVEKSTLVNFAEDNFTYYKGHAATENDVASGLAAAEGDMVWVSWNPASEGCHEAVYNTSTGSVVWNMGQNFMPQEGYTYQVRFKVWPSQAAYDLLADLNNGVKSYDSLSEKEKAQIKEPTTTDGMYTLKTNSETSYNYKDATIVDGTVTPNGEDLLVPAGKFDDVHPLELTTKPLKVKKQWHENYAASREPVSSITMELYGVSADGTWSQDFKTITLNETGKWQADDNYISYGLVTYNTETNGDEKIYETGHDFTLRETDDEAHYYELSAGIFRPMFINNVPTILERLDAPPAGMSESVFHYYDGSRHYYKLDGKVYQDTQSDILLIATNSRRSYMDLNKVVVNESGAATVDDTEFEYHITFTVPSGIANYDEIEKYIWFSVYDTVARRTLAPSEYICSGVITPAQENPKFSGPEYANYLVAISGQEVTLKIKQGWNVRFLNLPIGTTYSFEETNIPDGYDFVKAEVSGTRWIADMVDGEDKGSAQTMSPLPVNSSADNNNTEIKGTIDYANARYNTTYTNKTLTREVKILKTGQNGITPLSGAVFSLYSENGYNADPKTASKTGLSSDADGMIDLGNLSYGKYYLVETSAPAGYIPLSAPVEIAVNTSGVTYIQNDNSLSLNENGIEYDQETYTLTVINNAGYELPSTGGPGTWSFTILGCVFVAGAVLLLLRKLKTI